jgi:hypothetical protein
MGMGHVLSIHGIVGGHDTFGYPGLHLPLVVVKGLVDRLKVSARFLVLDFHPDCQSNFTGNFISGANCW